MLMSINPEYESPQPASPSSEFVHLADLLLHERSMMMAMIFASHGIVPVVGNLSIEPTVQRGYERLVFDTVGQFRSGIDFPVLNVDLPRLGGL